MRDLVIKAMNTLGVGGWNKGGMSKSKYGRISGFPVRAMVCNKTAGTSYRSARK